MVMDEKDEKIHHCYHISAPFLKKGGTEVGQLSPCCRYSKQEDFSVFFCNFVNIGVKQNNQFSFLLISIHRFF